jgi:DNA repair exonuclease SbcCD ATPase subunit
MANIERAHPVALTSLPSIEDIPQVEEGGGYDADAVRNALDSYRRHALQLQAQLRVLQAAGRVANVDPTGHAVRMDALHLIRAAAEFADVLERDAQTASAAQLGRTEAEISRRQRELQDAERTLERYREESERQRNDLMNAARNEAREQLAAASRDSAAELREAEARGARLLEQARHQATELTNAARAEVEQTLEWSRSQATAIVARAQQGAEQLLAAAGLGPEALTEISDAILAAAHAAAEAAQSRAARSEGAPSAAAQPRQGGSRLFEELARDKPADDAVPEADAETASADDDPPTEPEPGAGDG